MSLKNTPHVIRAFTLPVPAFDHLKNLQRLHQHTANKEANPAHITNSVTLSRILSDHYKLGLVAGQNGMQVHELCDALALGRLVVSKPLVSAGSSL